MELGLARYRAWLLIRSAKGPERLVPWRHAKAELDMTALAGTRGKALSPRQVTGGA